MDLQNVPVECLQIAGAKALDPIHVFWINCGLGKGYVTIMCYGQAWTAYFGAMGDRTIQEFFADASVEYLSGKMGITSSLKQGKKYESYLCRIIEAVKAAVGTANASLNEATPPAGGNK